MCKAKFIFVEYIAMAESLSRKYVRISSKCEGQGYSRCGCDGRCKSDSVVVAKKNTL